MNLSVMLHMLLIIKTNKYIKELSNKIVIIYITETSKTNLKEGDEIISINNEYVYNKDDVTNMVNKLSVGSKVDIKVKNNNKEYTIYAYIIEKEMNKIKLIEIEKEIDKYKRLLKEVSEDYKSDFISKDDFDDFNSNYLYELNKLQIEKDNIVNSKVKTKDLNWLEKFKATNKINEIDRNIVEQFIENIYVNNDKTVEIRLKYKDQYEDAIIYLKNQKM